MKRALVHFFLAVSLTAMVVIAPVVVVGETVIDDYQAELAQKRKERCEPRGYARSDSTGAGTAANVQGCEAIAAGGATGAAPPTTE